MSLESALWPTGSTCPIDKPIQPTNFYANWTVDEFNDDDNNTFVSSDASDHAG
jgi:hypothetical protein